MGCEKLQKICENIGSDVTFMLRGGLGRLRGKGDDVEHFQLISPLYFALTTFEEELSSREVYAAFDNIMQPTNAKKLQRLQSENDKLLTLLAQGAIERALTHFSNDIQQAAASISDYADKYLNFTKAKGLNAVMTGSGSAYYIPFQSRTEAEKTVNMLTFCGFSSILCQSVPRGIEII